MTGRNVGLNRAIGVPEFSRFFRRFGPRAWPEAADSEARGVTRRLMSRRTRGGPADEDRPRPGGGSMRPRRFGPCCRANWASLRRPGTGTGR
ncbi:hypothetical protein QJS10_CPA02g00140 [Acorus calamus]|uniref:Uncharacterized protein n=1 Tax=Acorus calamus TaxID=4465 RepID=A0AAV9FDD7_ACOCL|nr:hypothetical protein QJS10_CPA02g00140 [Acorus calamus]